MPPGSKKGFAGFSKTRPLDAPDRISKRGYRSLQVEKHLIFYGVGTGVVEITGVPHIRMDAKWHFKNVFDFCLSPSNPEGGSGSRIYRPATCSSRFDCGKSELNEFLRRFALSNQRANLAQTYVLCRGPVVIAYYSLAVGQVSHEDAPRRITQGLGNYAVPLMTLARLAVTQGEQGCGWGASLLKDALQRTAQAADIDGIRACEGRRGAGVL